MKQLSVKKTISYRWWRSDDKDILKEHEELLRESADERISEMTKDGYLSGELNSDINVTDDSDDIVEYHGWWEVKDY